MSSPGVRCVKPGSFIALLNIVGTWCMCVCIHVYVCAYMCTCVCTVHMRT